MILDALFGHPGYSYGFDPMSSNPVNASLWLGDPDLGGVQVSGVDYLPIAGDSVTYYADSVDGENKTYTGPVLEWGPITSNWGDVDHLVLGLGTNLWAIPLSTTYSMLIGAILRLSLPDLLYHYADQTLMSGPMVELRQRILYSAFANTFMPVDPVSGRAFGASAWEVGLFVGDPELGGLEPDTAIYWDYHRVSSSGFFAFSTTDGYSIAMSRPAGMVWDMCQTDWGALDHWGFFSVDNGDLYHSGPITSGVINAVAGYRISIPVGNWVAFLGEPV